MLVACVGHSADLDAEIAINDILEQCREQLNHKPQAGILISSVNTDHSLILNRINEAFPGLELIGCSADGEVSTQLSFQEDSTTLVLLSSDTVEMKACVARQISEDPLQTIQYALENTLSKQDEPPKLCLTTPECLTASSGIIVEAIARGLGKGCPVFGGFAADQWTFTETFQFFGTEVLHDSVPMLLFFGPLKTSYGIASGWEPMGEKRTVTRSSASTVFEIDGSSALAFYQDLLGPHAVPSGEFPLAVYEPGGSSTYLRAPFAYDDETGSITFAGEVPEGVTVQICDTTRDDILEATRHSLETALNAYPGQQPSLGLFFSCAARKLLLGTRTSEEFERFQSALPAGVPVCGYYAYGEIGTREGGSTPRVHNETFISLVLGDK